jgi:cyclophilin family peptidyl-prolyl cis-trans isomerase
MISRGLCAALGTALFVSLGCDENEGVTRSIPAPPEVVRMETSMGDIDVELFRDQAPITVDNFVRYATEGFYDSLIIHRVIGDFIIQGGGFDAALTLQPPHAPIPNEASQALSNERGTIAMARTSDPHSATSQFFFNLKDNLFLDHRNDTPQGYGYAVFGRVIAGMDVVDSIGVVPTGSQGGLNDVPIVPVFIYTVDVNGLWKGAAAPSN